VDAEPAIPASLRALKDNARSVADDAHTEAVAEIDRWWAMLISVATESLGELWQYADKRRPASFSLDAAQVSFGVHVTGHRVIYASFAANTPRWLNQFGSPGMKPAWWRARWSGSAIDVPDGVPYWFVPSLRRDCIGTYHQTLGSALNYAEER
jgi:hypothetical protein